MGDAASPWANPVPPHVAPTWTAATLWASAVTLTAAARCVAIQERVDMDHHHICPLPLGAWGGVFGGNVFKMLMVIRADSCCRQRWRPIPKVSPILGIGRLCSAWGPIGAIANGPWAAAVRWAPATPWTTATRRAVATHGPLRPHGFGILRGHHRLRRRHGLWHSQVLLRPMRCGATFGSGYRMAYCDCLGWAIPLAAATTCAAATT